MSCSQNCGTCSICELDNILQVIQDIMLGGKHSRRTLARYGISLATADRWIKQISEQLPGACKEKIRKTTWLMWKTTVHRKELLNKLTEEREKLGLY